MMKESADILARRLLSLGDLEGAKRIAETELQHAADTGNTTEIWKARFVRAEALAGQGRVEESLRYLESLALPDLRDLESCSALRMHRGSLAGSLGQYDHAHRLLREAEEIARDTDLLDLLAEVHLRQALTYFLQKDYASSECKFRTVLDLAEQIGGWYFRGNALWGIGKNLMIQGQYREAKPWLDESLRIFEPAGARLSVALVWSELAVCSLGLGQDEESLELLRRAEQVNLEAGFVHNYQVVLANIGNVYLHRRDHFMAISYYRRALKLAREIKDPVSIKKWTFNINLAYARVREAVDQYKPRIA